MLHLLALAATKLYFIVFVFLFSFILRTPGKEMGSCVVDFGWAIVAILGYNVHV